MDEFTGAGERLRRARLAKPWTQSELSEASGVPSSTVCRIEQGNTPSIRSLRRLAETLGCDVLWLAHGDAKHDVPPSGEGDGGEGGCEGETKRPTDRDA
ncbi:MAG: helix-turn-helix domain-containing protein [Gammaproteobacteria bacterium]|nr:helix-turn-helix transcriptional regulator [Gammaproteobacteria bacterium]NIV51079.1 helix-turn-helix domain-containing protein [Gammaproteobacteria bacterium]NIW23928.1 helix-turn-helix domain-containing protein [Gammaproteobacteria bacterium]NIX85021.1 helix-turn-helix domain-containing protein [Gammaproteobacteria bacterium]